MSSYKNVTSKPWEMQGLLGELTPQPTFAMPSAKVALILFMTVVTVLFSLFTVTYYLRMSLGDWVPLSSPPLLWLNTVLLVMSSLIFQRTRFVLKSSPDADVRVLFLIGGLFALAFVVGQFVVWQQLNNSGFYIASNPANTFFYLMTGLHVIHLLGGLWVWGKTSLLLLSREPAGNTGLSIELCTLYWHFLLLIWIVMFAILANT
jgi:cytochrome c oxidase subunit III